MGLQKAAEKVQSQEARSARANEAKPNAKRQRKAAASEEADGSTLLIADALLGPRLHPLPVSLSTKRGRLLAGCW